MRREDLFLAIGEVEESRLARCENLSASNVTALEEDNMNTNIKKRRPLRLMLIAAIVTVLLVTTVWAAPIALNAIFGEITDIEEFFTPTDPFGISEGKKTYQVELELDFNENAPKDVETFYLPDMPEGFTHSFGYAYAGYDFDNLDRVTSGWDLTDGTKMAVMLDQMTEEGFEYNRNISVSTQLENGPKLEQRELGGINGFLLMVPDDRSYFCWSDGNYVFYLGVTSDISLEQMAQIVESIYAVDDAKSHMISMTEDELNKVFGN